MTDLDFATVANFEERNFGVRGIVISQTPERVYTYGALAAHILGYVGKPREEREHLASDGTPYETIGLHGIESIMDPQLQGEPGSMIRRVSSQGYYIGEPLQENDPTIGNSIYLTIDSRVQYIAETAFRNSGWTRGSVVVMDPRNGDVLALASFPDYDPNQFIPRISGKDWDALNNDPTTADVQPRPARPESGLDLQDHDRAGGPPVGPRHRRHRFRLPGGDRDRRPPFPQLRFRRRRHDEPDRGDQGLQRYVFFYQYGIRAGIQAIDAMGQKAGFGPQVGPARRRGRGRGDPARPGMDEAERGVAEKDPQHRPLEQRADRQHRHRPGFRPLHAAAARDVSLLGGQRRDGLSAPALLACGQLQGRDHRGNPGGGRFTITLDVKPSQLKDVQQGMYDVVEEEGGTGNATAKIPGYHMGGKTGTAQHYRRVHGEREQDLTTWFYCYGPFEKPRYVTCVMVEGGTWGLDRRRADRLRDHETAIRHG